jgi:histidinol-phosphate aminotransferase
MPGHDAKRNSTGHCRELWYVLAEDVNIPVEAIMFGNGAEEYLNMIGQAFINPGDESLIPNPSFDSYRITTEFMEGEPIYVPLTDDCIDLNGLLDRVTDQTKIIWICSPKSPTGTVVSKLEFDSFLDRLPEGIVVVLDQAYWE